MNYKKFLLIILILICLVVFLVTSYVLLKDFKNFKENNNSNENLILETIEINEETQEKTIDWNYLKSINENIIGWIEIEGTKINYPILQDNGNLYYLRHNYNKKYISSGSIFTMNVNPFKDQETTIYGHNMKNGTMFSNLDKYWDKDFFYSHLRFKIYTQKCNYVATIFSVYSTSVESENSNVESLNFDEKVNYYKKASKYNVEEQNDVNKIVKLCTCSYINVKTRPTDKRYYIVADLIPF